MKIITLDWTELKTNFLTKSFLINHKNTEHGYHVYVQDRNLLWIAPVVTTADIEDFETNYKSKSNLCMYAPDGKEISRTESRPHGTTVYFTCRGDSETEIGKGKRFFWDFSNNDDLLDIPSGSTEKTKRIEFKFLDPTWIKEGTLYCHNTLKGSYLDLYVVCPTGYYYLDNNGSPVLAEEDTIICHYVISQFMQGNLPMGDELNTECCSEEIPSYLKFWLEITVPDNDNESNGYVSLELYRTRTIVL